MAASRMIWTSLNKNGYLAKIRSYRGTRDRRKRLAETVGFPSGLPFRCVNDGPFSDISKGDGYVALHHLFYETIG